jgi:hypothetical protein
VNAAIRAGTVERTVAAATPTFEMGPPRLPLDKALRLASDLEDDELVRKLAARK